MRVISLVTVGIGASLCLMGLACTDAGRGKGEGVTGRVRVDGSSTVYPVTEAVAEEFLAEKPGVKVTVGVSGTGGGFKKFALGETDINDASRPIKQSEIDKTREHGIEFIELPVAYDGISVVVNPRNDWVDHLTAAELQKIWQPGSTVQNWNDVREGWPGTPISLYGPGTDSGTFDYFTEAICGKSGACRPDFQASEDDNVLVQGVAGDENALGFFGFAYYVENSERLKIVPIDGGDGEGDGPVVPTPRSIEEGRYVPLSRPIFIYVNRQAADRPDVQAFVEFYLARAPDLAAEVGYVALSPEVYTIALERFRKRIAGSAFHGRETRGKKLVEILE